MTPRIMTLILASLVITACGDDSADLPDAAVTDVTGTTSETACSQGGTDCPDGLECTTYSDGRKMCVLIAQPAVILLKDITWGGRCIGETDLDTFPGATVGAIEMRALDRSTIIGYGKLVWDKTGKETAANRGHPPDGREYSDDICANGYNLGCGGQVVLEIVGRNGEVQNLREGQSLIVQTRQKDNCGEEFSDKLTAFVCSDPAAAGQGDLSSCTWEMPLTPLGRNLYGPDRVGGTITSFRPE